MITHGKLYVNPVHLYYIRKSNIILLEKDENIYFTNKFIYIFVTNIPGYIKNKFLKNNFRGLSPCRVTD